MEHERGATHLLVEDHATSRATQRLVSCGGHNVRVLKRRRDGAGSDKAGYVSHVCEHDGANAVGRARVT
jgi:hypothetical protein